VIIFRPFRVLCGVVVFYVPGLHPGLLDFALSGLCVVWFVFSSRGFTPGYWVFALSGLCVMWFVFSSRGFTPGY